MAHRDVCRFCHTDLCFGRGLTLRRTARKSYSSSISVSGIFYFYFSDRTLLVYLAITTLFRS